MLDDETAQRWAALPGFSTTARHWTWYREAMPSLLERLAGRTSRLTFRRLLKAFERNFPSQAREASVRVVRDAEKGEHLALQGRE